MFEVLFVGLSPGMSFVFMARVEFRLIRGRRWAGHGSQRFSELRAIIIDDAEVCAPIGFEQTPVL